MQRFILTVGLSLLNEVPLTDVHNERNIYRINGAHGEIADIEAYVKKIRSQVPDADILIDLPGNKVRTRNLDKGIVLEKGREFVIPNENFNYRDFYKHLKPGMTAWANDSIFEFEVLEATTEEIRFLSKSDGVLINNKGVHVRGIHEEIPFLFEKDKQLIELANLYGLDFIGLSFVRKSEDVKEAKELLNSKTQVISKIETIDAVQNINEILPLVRYILVDRGDLSTDIGIENVPRYQRFIIEKALFYDVKVFLATQILKNMETKPIPTIGEIEALYEIYKSGAYGVQMSEETAVGKYVKECVDMLYKMTTEVAAEGVSCI